MNYEESNAAGQYMLIILAFFGWTDPSILEDLPFLSITNKAALKSLHETNRVKSRYIRAVEFTPDGNYFATLNDFAFPTMLAIWEIMPTFRVTEDNYNVSVADDIRFSQDGGYLAVFSKSWTQPWRLICLVGVFSSSPIAKFTCFLL